ncbi:hypothetical protein [Vibrio europaeus]|uniref:hypothetical protein n=1 Tax=Vibrio europaeus TaxID=300876 RepID=UPI00233F5B2E|nr:hypothetical protein [Vibrio europaeus]MDC5753591.1 hypothetical protein [Vibrio europaeus]MDC5816496.1 hypothetical protein [Vibrio europaeus]
MTKLFSLSSLNSLKASSVREALELDHSFDEWFDGINEEQPYSICVSVTLGRHAWNYEVKIINMDTEQRVKSEKGHCHTVGELKDVARRLMRFANENDLEPVDESEEVRRPTITDVFAQYSITKVREGKYTLFLNYQKHEITRVAGGLRAVIMRSRLIRDSLLDGRSNNDEQPCAAYLDFEALEVGDSFKLIFPGSAHVAVFNCSKVSKSQVEWLDSEGNSKITEFNKGWGSARIEPDSPNGGEDETSDSVTEFMARVAKAMEKTKSFQSCWWLDSETNEILREAQKRGLVNRPSVTQIEWTEKGVAACRQVAA